jgi:hypothetical protein
MIAAKRRKIKQLRALAASTTFPAERDSANAKADALEAELGPDVEERTFDADRYLRFPTFEQAWASMSPSVRMRMEEQMRQQAQVDQMRHSQEEGQRLYNQWLQQQLDEINRGLGL